jgi:hypothetical protein
MFQDSTEAAISTALSLDRNLDRLYRLWWVGDSRELLQEVDCCSLRSPVRHDGEQWQVIERAEDGSVVVGRGGELAGVSAGDWLAIDHDTVWVLRRAAWHDGQFAWCASKQPRPPIARRWRTRIYIPGQRNSQFSLKRIAEVLDRTGLWFNAKTWLGNSCRQDQIVVWTATRDTLSAIDVLISEITCVDGWLPPPPLTLKYGPLGIAYDPIDSNSLGHLICGAVVSAGDLDPSYSVWERWTAACRLHHLRADRPWQHPGSIDPFSFWAKVETQMRHHAT